MTTQEVADQLVKYCQEGKWDQAQEELYSKDAISLEMPNTDFPERTEGLEAIKKKGELWGSMIHEVHSMTMQGPIVAGKYFTCNMINDVTYKEGLKRIKDEEVCVYKVENGKIVSEQFFY